MGWLIAIIVLPLLIVIVGVYAALKLTMLVLRIVFLPVSLMMRR